MPEVLTPFRFDYLRHLATGSHSQAAMNTSEGEGSSSANAYCENLGAAPRRTSRLSTVRNDPLSPVPGMTGWRRPSSRPPLPLEGGWSARPGVSNAIARSLHLYRRSNNPVFSRPLSKVSVDSHPRAPPASPITRSGRSAVVSSPKRVRRVTSSKSSNSRIGIWDKS